MFATFDAAQVRLVDLGIQCQCFLGSAHFQPQAPKSDANGLQGLVAFMVG